MRNIFLFWIFCFFLALIFPDVSLAFSQNSELTLIVGDTREKVSDKQLSEWVKVSPRLIFGSDRYANAENIYYCPWKYYFCDFLKTQRERYRIQKVSRHSVDHFKIKVFLENLSAKINRDPVDAKFKIEDGRVSAFAFSQNGFQLHIEESEKIIAEFISQNHPNQTNEIKLSWKVIEPKIKSEDINKMGIEVLIGEGISDFRGSPKNRIHNINVAASRFDGYLIRPEEEFSFVSVLGPVDGEHGYLPELVIKYNETKAEFGGGICQVSTTAFRAAIYSGMEIKARQNHAYPVQYYNPQGMDATVYIPRPDLRFKNNTPGHILIQTKIEGTKLIFRFFGTDDGRKVEIDGPYITERNSDGSMKSYFTQKVTDKKGNIIIDEVFKSAYESPNKYPHPGEEKITEKPDDWSKKQWKEYKREHNLD